MKIKTLNMPKNISVLIVVAVLFFFCGCNSFFTGKQQDDIEELVIDNGCFKVVMVNPDTAVNNKKYGCRFIKAGWIKELYLKGESRSIFRPHTVFPTHPTFGYTHEIVPALDLKMCDDGISAERLNIGVGTIKQNIEKRFKAEPIKTFPWQTTVKKESGKTIVESEQLSGNCGGYAYRLIVRTVFEKNSPIIKFEQILENTGTRNIAVSAYVHPFFNAMDGFDGCWYILPHRTEIILKGQKFVDILPKLVAATPGFLAHAGKKIAADENWVAAGNFFGENNTVCIYSDQTLEKIQFWRNKEDCFAVEPFIRLNILPGSKKSWKWFLVIIKNKVKVK